MSDQDFEPRAAARLIEEQRLRQGLSVRSTAPLADLSEGRWRQIAKGYQQAAAGIRVPANAPDATLGRMAWVVGVEPDALDAAGEEGVANEVRSLLIGQRRVPHDAPPLFGGNFSDPGYLANIEAWLLDLQTRVEAIERRLEDDAATTSHDVVDPPADEADRVTLTDDVEVDPADHVLAARDADDDEEAEAQQGEA